VGSRRDVFALLAFFALSAGVFYAGAKFHVPWFGGNDFSQYYLMTVNPFENGAEAPWAYRMLVPTTAHFVHKYGIFYDFQMTPFKDRYLLAEGTQYDASILHAIIFTNYVFIALAAFSVYKATQVAFSRSERQEKWLPMLLPSLLFLSLSTSVHGYAGLTEGGALFMVAVLCYLAMANRLLLFSLVCSASTLGRELVPLVLLVYVLSVAKQSRRSSFAIVSFLSFVLYFLVRSLLGFEGNEHQTDVSSLVSNVLEFRISRDFVFQAILANNTPFFVLLAALALGVVILRPFLPYLLVTLTLFMIGIASDIGNNVGRILNLATPILILGVAEFIRLSGRGDGGILRTSS